VENLVVKKVGIVEITDCGQVGVFGPPFAAFPPYSRGLLIADLGLRVVD
jgi:hypothetical protein